jgi:HlyD family secretion protein
MTEPEKERQASGRLPAFAVSGPRRAIPRWWLIAAATLIVVVGIYLLLGLRKAPAEGEDAETVVSVRVGKAERQSISAQVTALGSIVARREATVSAKIAAQIKRMPLLRDKFFKEGDVIAVLESRDIEAQRAEAAAALQEARANERSVANGSVPQTAAQDEKAISDATANLRNAREILERRRALYEQGGISKKELESSELAVVTAQNELKLAEKTASLHATTISPNDRALAEAKVAQAKERVASLDTQLSYATIRAPFSGIVTEQFQFQGEFASAGGKLFSIDDISEVIVKAPVGDTVAAQMKKGDPVVVYPQELNGDQIDAEISLVSRSSDPQSRAVEIWINLKNPGGRLRADSAAKVVISTSSADNVVVVPASAVSLDATNANEGVVMVVDANRIARETKVTVGIRNNDKMQITSGLQGGETIVVEGNYALPDGTKVEISNEEGTDSPGEDNRGHSPSQGEPAESGKKAGDER